MYSWGVLHHTPDTDRAIGAAQRVRKGRPLRSLSDVIAGHMESVGTRASTRAELRRRFAGLSGLRGEHVGTPYDRAVAAPLAALTGSRSGWFAVVRGRVPGR